MLDYEAINKCQRNGLTAVDMGREQMSFKGGTEQNEENRLDVKKWSGR